MKKFLLNHTLTVFVAAAFGQKAVSPDPFLGGQQAQKVDVSIDHRLAEAVLLALQSASLGHNEALSIARMPGNQGVIRKMREFNFAVTIDSFAKALVAAAHGKTVTDDSETILLFDRVKLKAPALQELGKQGEDDPEAFQRSIEERIALLTPSDMNVLLQGYLVA